MGMRITTGMAMNTYRYNLQLSTSNFNNAQNTVLTHRKFNSFSDDPSSAIQAWRVRRAMTDVGSYQKNNSDTYTRVNIAWVTMGKVKNEIADPDGRGSAIYGINGPTASARPELGKVLSNTAESVIHAMNSAKSGENFVFSGDDELNAPFSWSKDGTILYYRGVDVNAGSVKSPAEVPNWGEISEKTGCPEFMPENGKNAIEDAWIAYYRDAAKNPPPVNPAPKPSGMADPFAADTNKDDFGVPIRAAEVLKGSKMDGSPLDRPATEAEQLWAVYYKDQGDLKKLEDMSKEQAAIDLGMGLMEDADGKLVPGTYFDRSLPGINMLGFGVDKDGDPQNICIMMKQLGEIFSRCDETTGDYANKQDEADAERLLTKLKGGVDYVTNQYTDVDTKGSFLQQNESRLKMQGDYLNEQRAELEDVDLALAIQNFSWSYYCYSSALKVGTQLLSQSLIDYMT